MISPKKKLLMVVDGRARPFTMSGSFSNSPDGWTPPTQFFNYDTQAFRSAPTSVTGLGFFERTLEGREVSGLRITLSHWYRRLAGNGPIAMQYSVGGGTFVEFASISPSPAPTFAQMVGSFVNPGRRDQQLRLRFTTSNNDVRFDDWSITGARP